jgi:glutathione peroxidase
MKVPSIYDFKLDRIDGGTIDLSQYKGTRMLIVNLASDCAFTPQYKELQDIFHALHGELVVIGLPCNDFGGQEPGTEEEIRNECMLEYMVTFPVSKKIHIIEEPIHPLYQWLCKKEWNGQADHEVRWNFFKFLIEPDGRLAAMYPSTVSPTDPRIVDWAMSRPSGQIQS